MKKIIIIVVLLVVIVGGFIGYRMYSEKTPDVVNKNPDVVTDLNSILSAFETDTATAREKFVGKIVEITGNVKSIDTSGAVILGDLGNPSEVVVGLDRRHIKDHKKISVGSVAVMQGVCSGYSSGSNDPDDMLSALGTTVTFRSAGLKKKN